MYIEFLRLLETIDKTVLIKDLPSSDMVLQMLNIAQLRYLKEVYFGDGNHELILEKADTLPNLLVNETTSVLANGDTIFNYSNILNLNTLNKDFLFYVRSDSKVSRSAMPVVSEQWVTNEFIKVSDIDKYLTTPFNTPIIVKPGCYIQVTDTGLQLRILYDSYTTLGLSNTLHIEYLKKPNNIDFDIDSELPSFLHEEIVKLAVDLYINYYKFRLSGLTQSKEQ